MKVKRGREGGRRSERLAAEEERVHTHASRLFSHHGVS